MCVKLFILMIYQKTPSSLGNRTRLHTTQQHNLILRRNQSDKGYNIFFDQVQTDLSCSFQCQTESFRPHKFYRCRTHNQNP